MNRHNLLALTLIGALPSNVIGALPSNVVLVPAPEPDRVSDEDLARQADRTISAQALGAPRNRAERRERDRRDRRAQALTRGRQ